MKSKSVRKEEAIIRQKEYSDLTIEQRIVKLDKKFGKDLGAKKERAKYPAPKKKKEVPTGIN